MKFKEVDILPFVNPKKAIDLTSYSRTLMYWNFHLIKPLLYKTEGFITYLVSEAGDEIFSHNASDTWGPEIVKAGTQALRAGGYL